MAGISSLSQRQLNLWFPRLDSAFGSCGDSPDLLDRFTASSFPFLPLQFGFFLSSALWPSFRMVLSVTVIQGPVFVGGRRTSFFPSLSFFLFSHQTRKVQAIISGDYKWGSCGCYSGPSLPPVGHASALCSSLCPCAGISYYLEGNLYFVPLSCYRVSLFFSAG